MREYIREWESGNVVSWWSSSVCSSSSLYNSSQDQNSTSRFQWRIWAPNCSSRTLRMRLSWSVLLPSTRGIIPERSADTTTVSEGGWSPSSSIFINQRRTRSPPAGQVSSGENCCLISREAASRSRRMRSRQFRRDFFYLTLTWTNRLDWI